jgi:hypothetical protein
MAHGLPVTGGMNETRSRRCVVWLDTATYQAAEELATLAGVDVDAFVEYVVNELHAHEVREGAMRARAGGGAEVISMGHERRRRSRSRG